ncbi:uncharacterized protein LOC143571931 isoform X2 [Bidens hawaiensis]|uniref:uncharacterized protein LOC143571931 isoform X2 n=1 Tax=Bidens hawaiensis TaxID=980011 RepID=UPI004049074D
MDYPSFNHHRYAHPPHNDRPNFYHHLIPSVNHPPPPPQPIPPPPPPSYNYTPDFTYLDAPKLSFFNPSPSRVFSRFDYRAGSRSDLGWHPHRNSIGLYSPNPQSESYYKPRFIEDINGIASHEQQVFSARKSNIYVEKYEPRYVPMSENQRVWEEDPKWVMKGKKNELGHNDETSYAYGRERERERDYEHEASKFNRIREGRDEYKPVQKKSVLLRIGKPNNSNSNRNRNHEQHSSKAYVVESNNSNHRGKDKDRDKDRDQTENSAVDLDVSFKSNALIAKPVVTPSSPVSDNNSTPSRNRKIKRVTEFDSPLSKFSERSARSRSSSRGFDNPSSSEKVPKQVVDKVTVSKGDNSSLLGPVLDQGDGKAGSKGPLSFRLKKKRKLMNPGSSSFDFQLAVKENNVKVESSKNISNARLSSVISFPTLEEIATGKVDKLPKKDVLELQDQNLDCVNSFGDDCTENKSLTAENVSMINDGVVSDLNPQPCGNQVSVNHVNDIQNISADVKLSPDVTDISVTSADDQTEIQKLSTEFVSFEVVNVSNSLCNESVNVQETSTIADKNSNVSSSLCDESVKMQETSTIVDTNPLESCSDEIIIIAPEKSEDQGFLNDVSRKEDESRVLEGTSNQTSLSGLSESSKDDFKESTHTVIIAEDNATQSSPRKEHFFDKDTVTEMVNLISSSVCTPSPDHKEPGTVSKDDLPPSFANDTVTFVVTDSTAKSGEPISDTLTSICSPKKVSISDSQMLDTISTDKTLSNLSIPENDNIFVKSVSEDIAQLNAPKTGMKMSHYEVTNTVPSAAQGSSVKTLGSNTNLPLKKPISGPAVSRVLAARSLPVFTNARINKTANNITKPRTWHRSPSNPASVPVSLPPKQIARGQNSYVRSGNSLVRKGAPVTAIASRSSVYQLNPSGPIEARNSAGSGNKVNNTYSRVAGSSAPVVRPKTPPLSGSTKLPDCPTDSRDLSSSPLEPLPTSSVEQRVSEDQIRTFSNSESQKIADEVVTGKKIQYVKRKSNQLVAASCSDQPIQDLDKTQPSLSSDSYYKRIKNQLIRTSVGDDSANTNVDKASKISIKRQSGKVWTLNSQSLRPQLFPWKRSRNWAYLMNASSNSSSSSISRKLLLSRKRETIYTRSKHGFSLRMSKLLSVGGASLKWSKSIERNSKRTNEEATLEVAAAEKKKREQHGTASATAEIKSRNNMSRDRIFRIGSVRYKMDPSRRTLQRISDEEPSISVQSKEEVKKTYIPKRLKIGHDEYVRIANGNQLVRNPKRRTRVFAIEKVRWSLHTARTRLAKKKKFCQFFTRFGKCNKDNGKCPYIHDSSKIAVCTKFLNGLCSDPNCKLTHKVIPERMQDCSYFLQGLCSNKHCPYRHVNVNSTASVCEGFLKGYCADGNECQKKHSYACPVFEATGSCPQGTKCKLHHPKSQLKRKHQSSAEQQTKNSRGRYFGSVRGEEVVRVSEKSYSKNDDVDEEGMLCQEGKFAEYISLDCGSEEGGDEVIGDTRTRLMISEPLGLGVGEIDELTKPIGIMNRVAK